MTWLSNPALLASLAVIIRVTAPLFTVLGHGISGRDLILLAGGLFPARLTGSFDTGGEAA